MITTDSSKIFDKTKPMLIHFRIASDKRLVSTEFGKVIFPDRTFKDACPGPAMCTVSREFSNYAFVTGHMINLEETSPAINDIVEWLLNNHANMYDNTSIYTIKHPSRGTYYATSVHRYPSTTFLSAVNSNGTAVNDGVTTITSDFTDFEYITSIQSSFDFILKNSCNNPADMEDAFNAFTDSLDEINLLNKIDVNWKNTADLPVIQPVDYNLVNDALNCGFLQVQQMTQPNGIAYDKNTRKVSINNIYRGFDFSVEELRQLAVWFNACNQLMTETVTRLVHKGYVRLRRVNILDRQQRNAQRLVQFLNR